MKFFGILVAFALVASAFALETEVSSTCLKCICEGSTNNCNKNAGCDSYGFCGPFHISKHYWEEAGSFENDFQKCANDYDCAEKTVKSYMEKYGKDCDGDGTTDCKDFALIHHKGRHGCPYSDYQSDSLYKYVADCMNRHKDQLQGGQQQSSLGSNIRQGAENVRQGGEQLRDNIQDKSQQFGQNVKEGSQNLGEKIKEKYHDSKDKLKEGYQDMKEGAASMKDNLQEKLRMGPQIGDEQHAQNVDQAARTGHSEDPLHKDVSKYPEGSQLHDDRSNLSPGQQKESMPVHEMVRQRRYALHF